MVKLVDLSQVLVPVFDGQGEQLLEDLSAVLLDLDLAGWVCSTLNHFDHDQRYCLCALF